MTQVHTDQMNQTIRLEKVPSRIVSLVPSQTELLFDLGLEHEVVGITKFCIHPNEWYQTKNRVGGTKHVNIQKIVSLKPDLIIGNKEENTKEDIDELRKIAPVWMSDIASLEDALQMINCIGELTGKNLKANLLVEEIRQKFMQIQKIPIPLNVLYFIWKDPDYVAGKNTFIDSMLIACGFNNVCTQERYPEYVENDMNNDVNLVDIVFLSSEPYPFKEKHFAYFQQKFPKAKIILVDGEMFSWYGSRMRLAPAYFKNLLSSITDSVGN